MDSKLKRSIEHENINPKLYKNKAKAAFNFPSSSSSSSSLSSDEFDGKNRSLHPNDGKKLKGKTVFISNNASKMELSNDDAGNSASALPNTNIISSTSSVNCNRGVKRRPLII